MSQSENTYLHEILFSKARTAFSGYPTIICQTFGNCRWLDLFCAKNYMNSIVLLGDSLIAEYDWQRHMSSYKVQNFGVPGATSADLRASLPEIKTKAGYADVIMVMIGTNDLLTGNDDFLHTLKKVLVQLSQDFPGAEILVNSLFPMVLPHLPDNAVSSLNTHIEALTMRTGCCFINTHRRFVDSKKQLFQEDGVHITLEAYSIWLRSFLEHIAFLIDND